MGARTVKCTCSCTDCGQPTNRRNKRTGKPVCFECSLQRRIDAVREMHAKSGPAWDKFLASTQTRGRPTVPRDAKGRWAPD